MSVAIESVAPGTPAFGAFLDVSEKVRGQTATPRALVELELARDAPWRRHGDAQPFVAFVGATPVAAIVASIDRRASTGCFGYFDGPNDDRIVAPLVDRALAWLREKNVSRVEGPVQVHALAGYRFQIAGQERRAFPGEPRNPAWYPLLFDRLGFSRSATWRTWDFEGWRVRAMRAFHRLQGWRSVWLRRQGYRTEEIDKTRFEQEEARLWPLVMTCYAGAPAFWGVDLDEYRYWNLAWKNADGVRGALLFRRGAEDPVGFGMGIHEKDRAILHSFGILPAHRGRGLAHLVLEHAFADIRDLKIPTVIGALAKEGSTKYDEMGGAPSRRYALYTRDTSPIAGARGHA